jgi:hypothetical protein
MLGCFDVFMSAFKPVPNKADIIHNSLMSMICHLHNLKVYVCPALKNNMAALLDFNHQVLVNDHVYFQILICAKFGIDIKDIVSLFCKSGANLCGNKHNLGTLVFACFIHDGNCTSRIQRITPNVVKLIFTNLEKAYQDDTDKGEIFKKMLFAGKRDRYDDKSLREANHARCLLQAAAFYHYTLSSELKSYLVALLAMNDNSTISDKQLELLAVLDKAFSGLPHIEVELEVKVLDCLGIDIQVRNSVTGKVYDVEFDGYLHHYYKTSQLKVMIPLHLLREDEARDSLLRSHGYEVKRFNSYDLAHVYNRLAGFIEDVKKMPKPAGTFTILKRLNVDGSKYNDSGSIPAPSSSSHAPVAASSSSRGPVAAPVMAKPSVGLPTSSVTPAIKPTP